MIDKLVTGEFDRVEMHHVRMTFSKTIDDVGRARPAKLLHLAGVIRRILVARLKYGTTILYYPPAGPNRIPMYRDIAILLATRPLFKHTVFHFHAGGLTDLISELSPIEHTLFTRAYSRPDCAIALSDLNPPDGERLGAGRNLIIPYGIEDNAPRFTRRAGNKQASTILFVGMLTKSKGVIVLLEACRILKDRSIKFEVQLMGHFASDSFEAEARKFVAANELASQVCFLGVRTGNEKWQTFADADIFCFPSFYESETFGLVVLEAMQFGLPVVATRWRGIPSLIDEGDSGHLAPVQNPKVVAAHLEMLIHEPEKARAMGELGRQRYLAEFTLERWRTRMEAAFLSVVSSK